MLTGGSFRKDYLLINKELRKRLWKCRKSTEIR
jgi:hypothetical protein